MSFEAEFQKLHEGLGLNSEYKQFILNNDSIDENEQRGPSTTSLIQEALIKIETQIIAQLNKIGAEDVEENMKSGNNFSYQSELGIPLPKPIELLEDEHDSISKKGRSNFESQSINSSKNNSQSWTIKKSKQQRKKHSKDFILIRILNADSIFSFNKVNSVITNKKSKVAIKDLDEKKIKDNMDQLFKCNACLLGGDAKANEFDHHMTKFYADIDFSNRKSLQILHSDLIYSSVNDIEYSVLIGNEKKLIMIQHKSLSNSSIFTKNKDVLQYLADSFYNALKKNNQSPRFFPIPIENNQKIYIHSSKFFKVSMEIDIILKIQNPKYSQLQTKLLTSLDLVESVLNLASHKGDVLIIGEIKYIQNQKDLKKQLMKDYMMFRFLYPEQDILLLGILGAKIDNKVDYEEWAEFVEVIKKDSCCSLMIGHLRHVNDTTVFFIDETINLYQYVKICNSFNSSKNM